MGQSRPNLLGNEGTKLESNGEMTVQKSIWDNGG